MPKEKPQVSLKWGKDIAIFCELQVAVPSVTPATHSSIPHKPDSTLLFFCSICFCFNLFGSLVSLLSHFPPMEKLLDTDTCLLITSLVIVHLVDMLVEKLIALVVSMIS